MHKVPATWLTDVTADEVTVIPADLNAEAQANQWSFSVTPDEGASLGVEDIEEFVAAVVRSRREALSKRGVRIGTMTFYCWFDEMAAQLRFSVVSADRASLPFGCSISHAKLSDVASEFLGRGCARGDTEAVSRLGVWSIPVP